MGRAMITNTHTKYGTLSKTFHWLIATLIFTLIGAGLYMVELPKGTYKGQIYALHKATGIVVLTLVTLRLLWRWRTITPTLPTDLSIWQKKAAHLTHGALYVLMFAGPLSGLTMSLCGGHAISFYGLFTIPPIAHGPSIIAHIAHDIHAALVYFWLVLLVAHIGAALYHHYVRRDDVLKRML